MEKTLNFFCSEVAYALQSQKPLTHTSPLRSQIPGTMFLSMTVLGTNQDHDHHFMCSPEGPVLKILSRVIRKRKPMKNTMDLNVNKAFILCKNSSLYCRTFYNVVTAIVRI